MENGRAQPPRAVASYRGRCVVVKVVPASRQASLWAFLKEVAAGPWRPDCQVRQTGVAVSPYLGQFRVGQGTPVSREGNRGTGMLMLEHLAAPVGHESVNTTMICARVLQAMAPDLSSPLDEL